MIPLDQLVVGNYYRCTYGKVGTYIIFSQYRGDGKWSDGFSSRTSKLRMDLCANLTLIKDVVAQEQVEYLTEEEYKKMMNEWNAHITAISSKPKPEPEIKLRWINR